MEPGYLSVLYKFVFLCEPSLSNDIKTKNKVLGQEQQTKKNPSYLNGSVMVLTLDMSFDASANNNCLLQLNVPSWESCANCGGPHTGLNRRRLRQSWLGHTEMKSGGFGLLINWQDLHHIHFHPPPLVSDPHPTLDSTTYCCRVIAWLLFWLCQRV